MAFGNSNRRILSAIIESTCCVLLSQAVRAAREIRAAPSTLHTHSSGADGTMALGSHRVTLRDFYAN